MFLICKLEIIIEPTSDSSREEQIRVCILSVEHKTWHIYIYTHTYSIQWLGEGLIPIKGKQVLLCIIDYAAFIEKDISGEMSIIMLINTGFYNLNHIKHTIRNTFLHHVFNLTPSIITPLRKNLLLVHK